MKMKNKYATFLSLISLAIVLMAAYVSMQASKFDDFAAAMLVYNIAFTTAVMGHNVYLSSKLERIKDLVEE